MKNFLLNFIFIQLLTVSTNLLGGTEESYQSNWEKLSDQEPYGEWEGMLEDKGYRLTRNKDFWELTINRGEEGKEDFLQGQVKERYRTFPGFDTEAKSLKW